MTIRCVCLAHINQVVVLSECHDSDHERISIQ